MLILHVDVACVCVGEKLRAEMRPVLRKRQSGEQDTAQGQETGDRRQEAVLRLWVQTEKQQ